MKILKEEVIFKCSAKNLWSILSDVTRCDGVPTINSINLEDECRGLEMSGMGQVKEKIIEINHDLMRLQYSAVETRTPINHHLATMQIFVKSEKECQLNWTTEIDPEIFADAIHQGMLISVEGLKKVL